MEFNAWKWREAVLEVTPPARNWLVNAEVGRQHMHFSNTPLTCVTTGQECVGGAVVLLEVRRP